MLKLMRKEQAEATKKGQIIPVAAGELPPCMELAVDDLVDG